LALDPAFVTLFYNELMNYKVFLAYVDEVFNVNLKNVDRNKVDEKSVRIIQSRAKDLQLYSSMQLEAAKNTLHDLEELNMTYPYHI
jgi:hypothetical protein